MKILNLKLRRDLMHMRGQVIAIALVAACGVALIVTARTGYESLLVSKSAYYAQYRFADVFAGLKRAPESVAEHIAAIPGVESVHTRLVFEITVDVPGLEEPATGRLISVPERRRPILNDLHIRKGRYVEPGRRGEVLVSEAFAEANGLELGDELGAIMNGRWERLRIVGIALSPEYIYEISGASVFPDSRRFGVMWMSRDVMGPAFDMEGAFNDVVALLSPGAIEADVIAEIDLILERYGGLDAFGREDQVSHRFISDEIAQNRISGVVLPAVFLGVAAFLLNIVLSRLVTMQRDQIAVLKAFGYRSSAVALHYLQFALVVVLLGALVGTPLGVWLGSLINAAYVQFYRFPLLRYDPGLEVVLLGVGVSALAAAVGAFGAVHRTLRLPPAEAMRPEPPAEYHAGYIERAGLRRFLSLNLRMIIRNILRRPTRAVLGVLAIALAVAILLIGRFFLDAIVEIADVQFRYVQRDDVTVTYHEPESARARHEIARLPGVLGAESFRAVPTRLRSGHRSRRVAILGLPAEGELRGLVGEDLRSIPLPAGGLLLTERLAEILEVRPGEHLTVEVLEGARPVKTVPVAALVNELVGLSAYMELGALNRLMQEGGTVSGAFLTVDSAEAGRLYGILKRMPAVSGVAVRDAALRSFEETIARSMGLSTAVLVFFSCVIAFAMVYNATRIALSERGRELASLRVLGFTRGEVSAMLLGEQALLLFLAIPIGFLLGYQICVLLAGAYQWELFRIPLVVRGHSYAFALVVILTAAVLSALIVRRRIDRLDLVEVLKTRE